MMDEDRFTLFGVYVSPTVADALEEYIYEQAGVVDLESYFEETTAPISTDDPGADATNDFVSELVSEFATLYDEAAFDAVEAVDPTEFRLISVAATPSQVTALRERFEAAATIQETDLRTVHTAIVAAKLETDV
ncbi:hypothetical protein [Natronolimnobius baerhuensis]|uniref:Uncharacterized protein n=1 Tax=Natronolimnobius baerhuensis TaxID=253108 RepID=A0A202E7U4_9EURY|nr:hypothetical protein [Natronolimnobius baerhuensis]OVE84208.1 hypothetical protein B2G88_07240 [Natronolimnobius baerhuensis]